MVEAGESLFIHELSSDAPTVIKSVAPPVWPFESNTANTRLVPDFTFVVQLYVAEPTGGFKTKVDPNGIRPAIDELVSWVPNGGDPPAYL